MKELCFPDSLNKGFQNDSILDSVPYGKGTRWKKNSQRHSSISLIREALADSASGEERIVEAFIETQTSEYIETNENIPEKPKGKKQTVDRCSIEACETQSPKKNKKS